MKIRIKGNTLRLRLSKSEVDHFAKDGQVSDSINFGETQLIYVLQQVNEREVKASFNGEFITVNLPKPVGEAWANSEQVSITEEMPIADDKVLSILVEKDFQCLKPRPGEDEGDLFENPEQDKC